VSVNSEIRPTSEHGDRATGLAAWFLRRLVLALEHGHITVVTPSGGRIEHRPARPRLDATLVLHRWRAIRRFVTHGDLGFAQAYIDGDWSSPDLTALIELAAQNTERLGRKVSGLLPVRILNRRRHLSKANTMAGSRRNIAFHYDLGNAFYRCWLDDSMTYSSALYQRAGQTLEDAREAGLDRIVDLLDLRGDDRVLEIGCGWGALAARLARRGARVTGVTLSSEQLAYASERIAAEGLGDKVSLALKDYRDVAGCYDRIVSIEMLEAVGEAYWPLYFRTLRERLKPGGKVVLQVITVDDKLFEGYRKSADFIQRYVFPGGMLPTQAIIAEQARAAGLTLGSVVTFGDSYARTLCEWRQRFLASWSKIEALGFPLRFRRLWEYYLCYCEAGFRAKTIDVGLYVLSPDVLSREVLSRAPRGTTR
jgi:cyclopropane-fatty-acyl-phospholipid synthase